MAPGLCWWPGCPSHGQLQQGPTPAHPAAAEHLPRKKKKEREEEAGDAFGGRLG